LQFLKPWVAAHKPFEKTWPVAPDAWSVSTEPVSALWHCLKLSVVNGSGWQTGCPGGPVTEGLGLHFVRCST
jgi:hypothetical protein